ncbi:PREDICTED: alpha-2B adrenergic receptor-like [Branchiostoma belcheri]|uniref:Alpha-2B adrenergic receptor-like n=1 Tax=Branchiostoma belcheri TaxID=7741 RepID=A0A6P4ZR04_BRABE|nr:PREDICTED: alpha-2B adrenergic receptor-like [Branchiostoma belcheri]
MSNESDAIVNETATDMLLQMAASAYSLPAKVAIGLAASTVMVMIIVGNILVCIAVVTERKLRHPQNWFLVSLAASDLLVGTLIMPFALAYELLGTWTFGSVWCEIWLAMDVFACTASIFNLCLIALERYRCVVNPTAYSSPTINRRQGFLIAGAYITAAAISVPPLFGWEEPHEQHGAVPVCPLHQSLGYVAFSATASFYIPLIVMVVAYICLIVATRAHLRKKKMTVCPPATPVASRQRTPLVTPKMMIKKKKTADVTNAKNVKHLKPPQMIRMQQFDAPAQQLAVSPMCAIETEDSSLQAQAQSNCIKVLQRVGTKLELQFDRNRKEECSPGQERLKILQSKERRFTLIIGLVMGAFIVCWYPFFQLYPIVVACKSCRVPDVVFKFCFWIGYCNSAANPVIYTIFNKDFRNAFLRIITCGLRNSRKQGKR